MKDFNEKLSEKEMLLFLLPLLLSGVFQQIFTPYSTAIAARYLTEESLAVVGALGACKSVEDAVFVGMTTGFSFCVNRAAGHSDPKRFLKVFREALCLAGGFLFISVVLALLPEPVLWLANVPVEIRQEAKGYLSFLLLAGGFWGMENLILCVVQGTGETRFPSVAVIVGTILQLAFLWLFLDRFSLGIEAVPLAILCYHVFLCMLLFGYLFRAAWGRQLFACFMERDSLKNRWPDFLELLKSGAAKASMMLMISMSFFVIQRELNRLSLEVLAGYAHASSLHLLIQQPLCVYATASGILSARTIGSGRRDLFRFYNRRLLIYSGLWCLLFLITVIPAAPVLLRFMAGRGAKEAVITAGVQWIRVAAVSYFLLSMLMVFRNGLQGLGCYRVLLFLGFCEMSVNLLWGFVFIPLWGYEAYCVSTIFRWGVPAMAAWYHYRKRGVLCSE